MGTNPAPRQRAALLVDVARTSAEPTLSVQTTETVSALLDVELTRAIYVGATLPFGFVQEDLASGTQAGLLDLRLRGQFVLYQGKQAAVLVGGLSLSLPTRTMTFAVDPGRQWVISPNLRYACEHGKLLWYALLMAPLELRPSGMAVDMSPAAGFGYRLTKNFSFGAGLSADIRVLNACSGADGVKLCPEGRPSEANRPVGATRLYITPTATFDVSENWSLFSGAQFPLLSRRDIEWQVSLGVEARF